MAIETMPQAYYEGLVATAREAAATGALFLDDKKPEWEMKIDLERLDVKLTPDCIVGQLYPDLYFERGLMALFGQDHLYRDDDGNWPAVTHGFSGDDRWYEYGQDIYFEELTKAWRYEVESRIPL